MQTDVVVATALQCNVVAINRPIVTEFVHAVAADDDRSTFTKPPIFLSLAAFRVGMHSFKQEVGGKHANNSILSTKRFHLTYVQSSPLDEVIIYHQRRHLARRRTELKAVAASLSLTHSFMVPQFQPPPPRNASGEFGWIRYHACMSIKDG